MFVIMFENFTKYEVLDS